MEKLELWGVYSPEHGLLAVHKTEESARKNKEVYQKYHREDLYTDIVLVHD